MGQVLSSSDVGTGEAEKSPPLLLHFDVNKTILLSDSKILKTVEDGIREAVSELFWGLVEESSGQKVWKWVETSPMVERPLDHGGVEALLDPASLITYQQFCKDNIADKKERKEAVKNFSKVFDRKASNAMEALVKLALEKNVLPGSVAGSDAATQAGLQSTTFVILPAFFHLVASLTKQERNFAIVFRSFGDDHNKIKLEWNAFCERRHPVFSSLLEGVGPLDGTQQGLPDRRVKEIHTLYRDASGPLLILDTFTNGPDAKQWDAWARSKPRPKEDTREGRAFVKDELRSNTIDGVVQMQEFLSDVLKTEGTAAIKDDWAWWQFHDEESHGGKLMPLLGDRDIQQIFFDDNVEVDDPRIVDVRYPDGSPVPKDKALNKFCLKVNPVEALLNNDYFMEKLQRATALASDPAGIYSNGQSESLWFSMCCSNARKETTKPPSTSADRSVGRTE